jgi:hypothetical protein
MAMTLLVQGNLMLTGIFGFLIGLIAEKLQLHVCFWTRMSKPLEILPLTAVLETLVKELLSQQS